jgi:activator of 2-hydroxyglutaryl-CoA dehydratase
MFAGGVAHNLCIRALLEESLGMSLVVPEQPDLVGALGAALYGLKIKDERLFRSVGDLKPDDFAKISEGEGP